MSGFSNPPRYAAETARDYVASLLALLGNRDPFDVMAATPGALHEATAGLSEEEARRPEAEGKWSVQQVVRHLADSELVYGYRIRLIVADEEPPIPGYDQDAWATRLGYHSGTLEEALDDVTALRAMNLRWFRDRTLDEMDRVGHHNERGAESVLHIARLLAAHDLLHLRQIARIRAGLGV